MNVFEALRVQRSHKQKKRRRKATSQKTKVRATFPPGNKCRVIFHSLVYRPALTAEYNCVSGLFLVIYSQRDLFVLQRLEAPCSLGLYCSSCVNTLLPVAEGKFCDIYLLKLVTIGSYFNSLFRCVVSRY